MSNMCTCHTDPDSCEWCRIQKVKNLFFSLKKPLPVINDVLWMVYRLEQYMIKEASVAPQYEDWESGSFASITEEMITAASFLKGMEGWENKCGSCRFFDPKESRCNERHIFVKKSSPKCPQWRYFG